MAFRKPHHRPARRRAFTLMELLVVVAILIILVGVLTAAMQPVLEGKEIREAARGLNAYVASSLARAAETGRPAGIWIQRQGGANSNSALDVFFADIPPLYAGDTVTARATINSTTNVNLSNSGQASVSGFIATGDRIRFFYAGPWYDITTASGASITFALGAKPPPPYASGDSVPFQIQRGPRPSSVEPFQMPSNTTIDLSQSGWANNANFASAQSDPVVILFNPDASVDRIYYHDGSSLVSRVVLGTIHLLVGRPGQIGAGNLASMENRWISISHQTGRVITTENAGGSLTNARQFGNAGSGMGGS